MAASRSSAPAPIRVGIGGWTYEPWRETFYPDDVSQKNELHFASRQVTAIEINGTYYSGQKPETFAKWRDDTPDGFKFSVKASRYATNRKVLAEAGESVERFVNGGVTELGDKLGPVLWQFAATKKFDPDDFGAFLDLLPDRVAGVPMRHVMDVRHASFMTPEYLALARKHKVATVFTDSDEFPSFADPTSDFVYARLMQAQSRLKTGYGPKALDQWTARARAWAAGPLPDDVPYVPDAKPAKAGKREVWMFFINGAKERAPAGAMALIKRLGKAG